MIHVHRLPSSMLFLGNVMIVEGPVADAGCRILGAVLNVELADRICVLLERHGLVDVPADAATLTTGFPPPDPHTKAG